MEGEDQIEKEVIHVQFLYGSIHMNIIDLLTFDASDLNMTVFEAIVCPFYSPASALLLLYLAFGTHLGKLLELGSGVKMTLL